MKHIRLLWRRDVILCTKHTENSQRIEIRQYKTSPKVTCRDLLHFLIQPTGFVQSLLAPLEKASEPSRAQGSFMMLSVAKGNVV